MSHLCTHLKLCISQSADRPDDGPSSSTPGFISSEPSVFTPGPASLHRVECLDAAERVAAYDFIGLETTDKVVLDGTFLPEIWHTQDSTHTATKKLIEAVSAAQFEDTQYSVANPTFASPSFSTMECVSAPPSLAQDQSAQVESSAITSQDTSSLPPAGKESAQVVSSAITSQDTAPRLVTGKESTQVESSVIVHGPAALSFAEKDITQGLHCSSSKATITSGRSTPLSLIKACSVVGLASQKNSGRISKMCLQRKVRASITSHLMPPNSTAHAETVHFIDFIDFMCAVLSD